MLKNKVAVITGESSGIGLATARRFAVEGASVLIFERRQSKLDKALCAITGDAHAVSSDVASSRDLDRLYALIAATTPAGRPGRGDELAAMVTFLASDARSSSTALNFRWMVGRDRSDGEHTDEPVMTHQ